MTSAFAVAACGAVIGGGLLAVAYGLTPQRESLADIAAAIRAPQQRAIAPNGWERLADRLTSAPSRSRRADLAIIERTPAQHALDKLAWAGLVGLFPLLIAASWNLGGMSMPLIVAVPLVAVAVVLGWLWPDLDLPSEAAKRRQAWGHALSTYLDLVGILLAGGAGAEEALHTAADWGAGPEFAVLSDTLNSARLEMRNPWTALDQLGEARGIRALRELAGSMGLAGTEGSRVRETLKAKAASLRLRELSDAEATAQKASETMSISPAAMLAVFVLFIGYPALASLLSAG